MEKGIWSSLIHLDIWFLKFQNMNPLKDHAHSFLLGSLRWKKDPCHQNLRILSLHKYNTTLLFIK